MARNYKELQALMDPASIADNKRRVREELRQCLRRLCHRKKPTASRFRRMGEV